MRKQDETRKLELRRERLRQLSGLPGGDLAQVAGGTAANVASERDSAGRVYSRTCCIF